MIYVFLEISSSISIGILVVSGLWEISLFSGSLADICCGAEITFERQLFRAWAKIKIVIYSVGTIGYGASIAGGQIFVNEGVCPFIANPAVASDIAARAESEATIKISSPSGELFVFLISVFLGVFIADSIFYAKLRIDPVASSESQIIIQLIKPYLAWFALIFLMLLTKKPPTIFLGGLTAVTVSFTYRFSFF